MTTRATAITMTDLKPCPFCVGGGDPRPSYDDWGHQTILCEYCGATARPAKWNSRPEEDRLQAKIEEYHQEFANSSLHAQKEALVRYRLRQRLRESVARELFQKALNVDGEFGWAGNVTPSARVESILMHYARLIRENREPAWVTKAIFGED